MKKRDAKGYAKFLKEQQEKKQKNKSVNNKEKNLSEIVKTKKHVSDLTDNELRKLNDRIKLENEYNNLIKEYNRNKNTTNKVMKTISKKILEPALIESSKAITQDLLTRIGKTSNNKVVYSYADLLNVEPYKENKKYKVKRK